MISWVYVLVMIYSCLAEVNIAIIGGGIGGASSAYFLSKIKSDKINIDLYESEKIGGRLATIEYNGKYYENGGSIIHSKNVLMKEFVDKFGLESKAPCSEDFGIFDGNNLLFKSSQNDYVTAFKLWWRYGNDIFRLNSYTGQMLNAFNRLYEIDECSNCLFNSTDDLLRYTGLDLESLKISTRDGLKHKGFSEQFIKEIISCIIRCNYCQSPSIHFFVGSVAIAGAGSELWSVKGGNWQVADRLIQASVTNFINKKVVSISAVKGDSKINVSTSARTKLYDYVIIATPLTERSDITFHGFHGKHTVKKETFHHTFCTLVKGKIYQNFFNTDGESLPDTILFTKKYHFNAISKINPVDSTCDPENQIWKIFSDNKLTDSQLSKLFESFFVISVTDWLAYPEYTSVSKNKSFYLFKDISNLFYVNAIETLASAMEMSALGGRTVASLVAKSINNPSIHNHFTATSHDEL